MAIFNPQVGNVPNDNMPNFFKYSDSISQPKADTSAGTTLETIGKGLEGAVTLADSTVKDVIKSDVYDRVDKERDAFSAVLQTTKDTGSPNGVATAAPSAVGETGPNQVPVNILTADNTTPVPQAINSGLDKIGTIQAGLNGNKISETTYYQRLNTIAKDLRATYPGYRDYIDQQISSTTGVTPANAYIQSIIQDINRQGASANKDNEFWKHQIVSNAGYAGSAEMLQQFNQTGDGNKVMQWLSYHQGVEKQLQLKKSVYDSQGQDRESQVRAGEDLANTAATHAATVHFTTTQRFANGNMSPADVADAMADLSAHPEKANDVAYQGLGERYEAMKAQAYNQTMRFLTSPSKDATGKLVSPVSDIIGMEKTKKIVDNTVGALFDKTSEFIKDKQFSPAYSLQNAASAMQNNALMKVLSSPTVGGAVQTMSALNKTIPNFIPLLQGKALATGLDQDLGTLLNEQGKQAVAQVGGRYQGIDGNTYTFKQSLEELNQAGAISGKETPGQAYNNLLEIRQAITDPNSTPAARHNAIRYFYDDINKGVMTKFMDDYYDSAKGGMVKGRSSAFATLTNEDVTKSIWEHAKASNPSDWQKYSGWAKGEFASQLGESVRNINKIDQEFNTRSSTGLPGNQYKVEWNNESHQLTLLNHDGTPLGGLQSTPLNSAYRSVNNLNLGLKSMANIAKTEGSNVDAYLFRVLRDNGFTPTNPVGGVGSEIMKALIVTNGGKVKEAPRSPASKFAPEDVGGDLKSFLTNPGGSQSPVDTLPVGPGPQQTRNVIKGNLSDLPMDMPVRTNQ